jgi:RHS repeat-associated protein
LVYYLYRYYDPHLQRWPNRDPIGESGFELLRFRSSKMLRAIRTLEKMGGLNLYAFLRNGSTDTYDSRGLAPGTPTGPGTLACIAAQDQADAALEQYMDDPTPENAALYDALQAAAIAACTPPPPPPPTCPIPPSNGPWSPNPPNLWPWVPPTVITIIIIVILSPVGA